MKRAIFPGVFDPFTIGHESIVKRGLEIFDEVVISLGTNSAKSTLFSIDKRIEMVEKVFEDFPAVKVMSYTGLTIEFAKSIRAQFILRGLRTSADFEYERAIAQVNKKMSNIDTVFLLTAPEHTPVNSTIVREILKHDGDVSMFTPSSIKIKDYL